MKKLQKNITVSNISYLPLLKTGAVFAALLFLLPMSSFASHMVGGSISYRCLGGQEYEVTLKVYRDCFFGAANAQFDNPASIGVFTAGNVNTFITELKIPFVEDDTLTNVLMDECLFVPSNVCVHTTTYKDTVTLQTSQVGYKMVYQRCCRNQTINNIIEPDQTGATYSIDLTPTAMAECNTSPTFNNFPPVFICVNNPIDFDHSASDPDPEGDSLVYKMCTPLSGATLAFPRPQPPNFPPYDPVVYQQGFGLTNLLGGQGNEFNQPLRINPSTGRLRGFPTVQGQYVVGVCVEEYRNGVKISETRRDFQYNVGECDEVNAVIVSPETQCDNLTVEFGNESTRADEFVWFFDYPNDDPAFMSNEANPTFTYPDIGTYTIALIAEPNSACVDTLMKEIFLQNNSLNADILVETFDCLDTSVIALTDLSTDTISPPDSWSWELIFNEDTLRSTQQNVVFSVPLGTSGIVNFTVMSENGCEQFISQAFETGNENPGGDIPSQVNICVGNSSGLNPTVDSLTSYNYMWSPVEGLDDPTSPNPIANPTETTVYTVTISPANNICTFSKVVTVNVFDRPQLAFEVGETSCDGLTLSFDNQSQNADDFLWYFGDETNSSTEVSPTFAFDSVGTYVVTLIGNNMGDCPDTLSQSITVEERTLEAAIGVTFAACMTDSVMVTFLDASSNSADNTNSWEWTFSNGPNSMEQNPSYTLAAGQDIIATLTISTDDGCMDTVQDTFMIETVSINLPDSMQICLGESMELNPDGNPGFQYQWSPSTGLDDPTVFNPIATPLETTTYSVTVSSVGSDVCQVEGSIVVFVPTPFDLVVTDDIMTCSSTTVLTGTGSSAGDLVYAWTNEAGEVIGNEQSITVPVSGEQIFTLTATDSLGCMMEDMVTVTGGSVDISVPDTVAVCEGEAINISVSNLDDNDTLTYSWTPIDLIISGADTANPVFDDIPGETTFTVVAENQYNCSATETVLLAVVDTTMMLSFESEVQCNGTSVQFTNTSTNAFAYFWNFGDGTTSTETNPIHDYSEAGTYDVYLTIQYDVSCTDTVFAQVTTIDPQLIADFTYDFSTGCANESVTIQFTDLSLNTFGNELMYSWDFGNDLTSIEQNPTLVLTESQTLMVTLVISSSNGCQDTTDVVIIDVEVPDVPEIQDEQMICLGESVPLNPNGNPDYTYVWTPEEGLDDPMAVNPIANPTETTTYTVNITITTDTDTCQITQEVTVIVGDMVEVIAPADTTTCGESLILTAIGSDTLDYVWTDSNGNTISEEMSVTVNPNDMETYVVTVSNNAGCTASDSTTVINNEVNVEVENGTQISVCENEELILTANNLDANDTLTCVWTTDGPGVIISGGDTPTPTVMGSTDGPTTFILECINQFECVSTIEVVVSVIEFDAGIPLGVDICAGIPTPISPNSNPDFTYLWSPADCVDDPTSPNPTVTVDEDKILTVMVSMESAGTLCEMQLTVNVNVPAPIQLETSKDTVLCEVTDLTLFASSSVPVLYQWFENEMDLNEEDSTILVMPSLGTTTYTVIATDNFGCIDQNSIAVNTAPIDVELNNEMEICADIDTDITVLNQNPDQTLTYEWSPTDIIVGATDEATVSINTDMSGTLSVNISNNAGCMAMEDIALSVIDIASGLTASATPDTIVLGGTSTLSAGTIDPNCSYEWTSVPASNMDDPNSPTTETTPTEGGDIIYTVTATKGECSASDEVSLRVLEVLCQYPNIFFPNTFTPNNDGENDELEVYSTQDFIESMELIIYNRWGQQVFKSNSQADKWDGTFNGEQLQPDVFGYYLKVQCVNGEELIDKGNVSILK